MIKNLWEILKINHYIKNIVVLIPIFFYTNFHDVHSLQKCFYILISFCCISSAVYLFNDLIDIEKDKCHSIKKNRPVTSGKITKIQTIIFIFSLTILSLFLAFYVKISCCLTVVAYFVLNVVYSFWLKNVVIIDALCIASGFILRVLCGYIALSIFPSNLLLFFIFFTSLFFTFTKRKLELQSNIENFRVSIKKLNIKTINKIIFFNAILSILSYCLWILLENNSLYIKNPYLYITIIPFILIILRFLLINKINNEYDPICYIQKDNLIKILIIIYFTILLAIIILC